MYNDFRILVSQYNEIILYWKNIKTLFILPNITTDIGNVEKKFFPINTDVLNSKDQEDLIKADFCGNFAKCFELINSTKNFRLNGLNSAAALYKK